jgi:diguanylate cyclase (GGDEF)-like protein/PAS domain S-box-containing protein
MAWQPDDVSRIIEQMPIGVAVTAPTGSIEYANAQLCGMFRVDVERLAGVDLASFRASASASQRDHMKLRLLAGGPWQDEAHFRTGSGELLHVFESAYPLRDTEGRVTHFTHLLQDLSFLKISETLNNLAFHDRLTGLPTGNLFHNRLALALAGARRARHGFAVLSAGIDRFRLVNDSLGRNAGDELLRQVAARLRACLRETDTVARMGGDEFAVILDRVLDPELAARMAAKLLAECCGDYDLHGNRLRITMSVGLSLYPRDGQDADTLLRRAELAMYRAKATGGNRLQLREPSPRLGYGFAPDRALLSCDRDRFAETQARFQLRRDMNDAVRVDEHRARNAHARGRCSPAPSAFDEDRLGSGIR